MAKEKCEKNTYVGIAGTLGGILLVILLFLMLFAKEHMTVVAVNVAWAFVVLGFFLGLFSFLSVKKK